MAHNFHDINGWLIVGVERHLGLQIFPPMMMPFWKLNLMHPFTMGGNEKPTVMFNGVPSVVHQHEPRFLWPHLGIIPHPADALTPLHIAIGSHKCWLPRGAVEICGEKSTCCVIGGPVSLNADCWDLGKWPTSLVLNPGTVETTPSLGDFLMGAVTLAIDLALDIALRGLFKIGGKLLGKFAGKYLKPLFSKAKNLLSKGFKAAAKGLSKAGKAVKNALSKAKSACKNAKCKLKLEPVDLATGRVMESEVDLSLPGTIPLVWERHYASDQALERTSLGRGGWTHSLEQWVERSDDGITLRDEEGHDVYFPRLEAGERAFHRPDRLTLTALDDGGFAVHSHELRITREFAPTASGGKALLRAIRDAHGNVMTLEYANERLHRVFDTAGREVRVKMSHGGRIVRLEVWSGDRLEQWVDYAYSKMGELAAVTDALGHAERYAYDEDHRMVTKTLKNGTSFYYAYDEETGWCKRSWGDEGLHTGDIRVDLDRRITYLTGNDEPRVLHWNDDGLILREETPDGILIGTWDYDDDQYLVAEANGAGETTRYEYDERGNKVRQVDPAGNVTEWDYEDNLPAVRVGPDGLSTKYEHDARGTLVGVTYPSSLHYALDYDDHGRLSSVRGEEGVLTALAYDAQHNVVEEIDARRARTVYRYDGLGRPVSRKDALGRTTTVRYDHLGQPTAIWQPDGTLTQLTYDTRGNPVRTVDALEQVAEMEYSGTGVISKLTQPDGRVWAFKYTADEKLRKVTNPRGEDYEFGYDTAGRVVTETTFDGRGLKYSYSNAGRLCRIDYPDGSFRAFSHDSLGNVLGEESTDGPIAFQRDRMGRLLGAVVQQGGKEVVTLFERDAFGRVVTEKQDARTLRFDYDARGRRTERVMPGGATTRYLYDALDQLVGLEHDGHRITIERDVLGRETARGDVQRLVTIRSSYDTMDRIIEQRVTVPTPGEGVPAAVVERRWRYDALGQVTRIDDGRWGTTAYRYDAVGQLLEARRSAHQEVFDYDAARSIHKMLDRLDDDTTEVDGQLWESARGNLLLRTDKARYAYDSRGRRVRKVDGASGAEGAITEYGWDCRDRLREVRLPSGTTIAFTYDAFGRRMRKEVRSEDERASRILEFAWDGDVLASDIDNRDGIRCFVHEPGTFIPLLQQEGGEVFSYVNDHLGMPKELVDRAGRVAWSAVHSAWGSVAEVSRDRAYDKQMGRPVESPFRLLGQYADQETGLRYTRFRYFDAEIGRWCSPDPLGLDGGANLFGFDGSPLEVTDPFGLACSRGAAESLPQMKGSSVARAEATLARHGFTRTHVSNSPARNQTWSHPDGSEVRIHPYGNQATAPYRSANNAHIHKQGAGGQQLTDRGTPSTDPAETHIGIRNPNDLPAVRDRPHGAGTQ